MIKAKILVTGIIPEQGLTELREVFDVTYEPEKETREWILANVKNFDGLLLMGTKGDRELIDAGSNLKIITANGVGFDHIDIEYAKSKGIVVSNCPMGVRVPTAEMTFALILATVRRLYFYDKVVRSGNWMDVSEQKYMGMSLQGKTLGVYGMGRIGSEVAKFCQVLGMNVIYNDARRLDKDLEEKLAVKFVDFDTLVSTSDVITLHAPALPSTVGIFNENVFDKMKNTAYLVNAARGILVKQNDLIKALQDGQIAGAGLDVFETEPNIPESLRALDNVILSPHAGTGTLEARTAIAKEASQNLISFLRDGTAINQVNK
ncbi:NAD(P)-dependent oxidoreductase [Furfurilactobacillus rossiae]|uniref:Glyoxylate reductase n=1 Tax=Furfurilactobacillus rossiae DSM 15814 TaxID=1114972 RepID=A0A0R1RQ38_9LACO|nr:NAD(P)-dependent oxidoreductase [Furfurilactobacillus rossiae]KRL56085.1 glyoxylate reductase [Furfurilactobacillus rossiae DSM 15814]MCF6166590.1 dihydrofolate reductase [Furfurilactobacillus rossiae]QFR66111.1 dihydrofolate reductase [Furfurilactobacillus rossiae]QLE61539.1 Glyoxylate reductase [Furfurilactobacillus rossiae]QLE64336.1 Glyoxylate reductase [Furfurilactobacillus rossiae]